MKKIFVNVRELEKLQLQFQDKEKIIKEASDFIKEIEKGNLSGKVSEQLIQNELGGTLLSMQKHLSRIATEEAERTWVNTGLAKFVDILRNKESLDLKDLSDNILMNLVRYVNANQGAIFMLENSVKGEEHLEIIACYAYDRKKFINKRIEIGEGLVGQCVLEREIIYMTEIPDDYIRITSGLGGANPGSILIIPLLLNDKIFGVLELASFEKIPSYKIDFIKRLAENIASSIKNVKDNERTRLLLSASQQQAEELRAQEEEMRQNMEEMQATQEEMGRKNEEIARKAAESQSILTGINATMATIEFTPDGQILGANENFLRAMKCTLQEIKGKHHRSFVPKDIQVTNDYETFWTRLSSGIPISGVFKRINLKGETVWLNAIYNPIFNEKKEVIKVVKFATDITAEQEMLAENKGILSGINATMATIEFTPEGIVLTANNNFLKSMQCSMEDIKGKHHRNFVPKHLLMTEEYKAFWPGLASGISNSGVFERINSKGEKVWLNAIYNPITNANGDVIKVVKFATDITTEKKKEEEVRQLLEESRAQEEEIRQSLEEMQTTQEEMERKNAEIANTVAEMESILKGVNATMATIEFTTEGIVLDANASFLSTMKCSLEDIKGKHHKAFVPKAILESNDYKNFWIRLASGEAISGIFERINLKGETVWLNAIYNPILNASGEVIKVMKFATDITAEKNKSNK